MPYPAGTRLGPYEVLASIGAGGMGEVYKARDSRLGRDVALKVLHPSIAADPEARARFEREARAISQLNHPNICVLYDVGEDTTAGSPALYLVMEFLEGESLAARIARGPIPPDEAVDYAMQMADALDKAHRQGIVHRDLKPANVILTKAAAARSTVTTTLPATSVAKLLDFGLAKLAPPPTIGSLETMMASSGPSHVSRNPANPATAQGTILGTFQYMAPEQVEGREVDARADIWAFGCVLYEMVTGRRAFEGRTQASLIAGILERDPSPVAELQPLTPPALGRLIRICLAKDPNARFQSAYDLLLQLQWIAEGGSAVGLPAPVIAHRKRRERAMWMAVAGLTLALGAAAAWVLKPAPVVTNVVERFSYALPEPQAFTRTGRRYLAMSPNGERMAYVADKKLYLREMHQLAAVAIVGTEEDPLDPVFSPDGLWIAYFVPNGGQNFTLKKIQIGGGTPVPLCKTGWPFGISWHGNTILFGQNSDAVHGIQSVHDSSGTPTTLISVDKVEQVANPQMLGDGAVLFTVRPTSATEWESGEIAIQAPGDKARTAVIKGGSDGRVVASDRLVYYKGGTLFATAFDLGARTARGGALPIVEGVQSTITGTGAGQYSIADSGTLVYVPGTAADTENARQLVWVDRKGKEEPIAGAPLRGYLYPRLSPTGDRLVAVVDDGSSSRLFTFEFERAVLTPLTPAGEHNDIAPIWTIDGKHIIYQTTAGGASSIMRVDASGAMAPERILDLGKSDANTFPESLTPDGKTLILRKATDLIPDLVAISLEGADRSLRPLLAGPTGEIHGRVSPDGRLIAYAAGETASENQVFIRPYPNVADDRVQVSTTPASGDPVWSKSSRELFFTSGSKISSVAVLGNMRFGRFTDVLDNTPYLPGSRTGVHYDIAANGEKFLMVKRRAAVEAAGTTRPIITIVTHWIDELKARVK